MFSIRGYMYFLVPLLHREARLLLKVVLTIVMMALLLQLLVKDAFTVSQQDKD